MSIGQLTLLSLFFDCFVTVALRSFCVWLCAAWRFQIGFEQHCLQNYERRSWTSAFCVLYWDFCLRQVRCRIKKPVYHRIPVLPRYPIGIFLCFPESKCKTWTGTIYSCWVHWFAMFFFNRRARDPRFLRGPRPRREGFWERRGRVAAATVQEGCPANSEDPHRTVGVLICKLNKYHGLLLWGFDKWISPW